MNSRVPIRKMPTQSHPDRPDAPATSGGPYLSVAIATHDRPDGLKRLLMALGPQIANGHEIVVVNDGSHDARYDAVVAAFGGGVRYDVFDQNRGVAAARNRCVELASGDYVVFIDDDCVPPSWWLDWLTAVLRHDPDLDVVAGTTHPLWPSRRRFSARLQAHYALFPRPQKARDDILFVTANVAIRRAVLLKTGGFGFPGFQGVGEDTELSNRLRLAGASMRIDASWHVFHDVGERLDRLCRRYWRYGYANAANLRLTTWPWAHDSVGQAPHFSPRQWRTRYREFRAASAGFSALPWMRAFSAAAATAVSVAYRNGAAAGNRDRAGMI